MTQGTQDNAAKIAKDNLALITNHDILDSYHIAQASRIGSEVEHIILHPDNRLITASEHDTLSRIFKRAGIAVTSEPLASIFEVKTDAHQTSADLIHQMTPIRTQLFTMTREQSYVPHEIGYLGDVTLAQAHAHSIPNERMDGLMDDFCASGQGMCARQPLMTASVHLSISYRDIDHAYQIGKMLMVLTPVLSALCANGGARFDGRDCDFNPSTTIRLSQPYGRGGLSPCIIHARDGDHMMTLQTDHIMKTPMMMHYNAHQSMRVRDDLGQHPTLEDLQKTGLNTASNAMLSESMQYHMLKLTSLRNGRGEMTGKRLELRMADNGPFQHDLMAMVAGSIALSPDFPTQLCRELTHAGLNPFAPDTGPMMEHAMHTIARNRVNAMHTQFGTASVGKISHLLLSLLQDNHNTTHPGQDALRQARLSLG